MSKNETDKKSVSTEDVVIIDGVEYETQEQKEFRECVEKVKKKLNHIELCLENIMVIVRYCMEVVELTRYKGHEQKKLVIKLVKKIVIDSPISDEKEKLLLDMLNSGILSATIDLVVAASRGELLINVVKKKCSTSCFSFLK